MNRDQFRTRFVAPGPVVLPVIHVLDADQAARNGDIAFTHGAHGLFLINHDFDVATFLPIVRDVRARFPDQWIGVNFLAVTGEQAFPILASLQNEDCAINAYWADDACIDERRGPNAQADAERIATVRQRSGWTGMYFGGTAFKKQRDVSPQAYGAAAQMACAHMDVVTTSGIATGQAADLTKIVVFRHNVADQPLALASGVTPDNISDYRSIVDAVLVATGINHSGDFYNIDPEKLSQLIDQCK